MPRRALTVPFLLVLVAAAPPLPGFNAAVGPTPPAAAAPVAPGPTSPGLTSPGAATPAPAAAGVLPAAPVSAADYMNLAAQAVAQRHDKPALRALGHAETRLISRSVPLFQTRALDTTTPVRLIEQARQAIRAGDFDAAAQLIARATPLVAQAEAPAPAAH